MNDDLASREISPDLREFMNRLPGGTAIYELAGKSMIELYVNDSYYHMIGESRDQRHDYEGSGCLNATLNEDQHIVKKAIRELADGALHEDITFRINKKPDGFTWVRLLADAHHLSDGRVLIYCNYSNVDEQMRREIELSSSKILAEVCMRNTKTCAWEYYPDTRLAVFSDFAQKSLSLPRSVKNPYNSLINSGFIHPDSINEHHLLFSGEFPNKSQIRQSLKIRTADRKDWRWVESIMAPVYDTKGKLIKAIGTTTDITRQKETEKQYRKTLRDMDEMQSPDLIAKRRYDLTANRMDYYIRMSEDAIQVSQGEYEAGLSATANTAVMDNDRVRMLTVFEREELIRKFNEGITYTTYDYQRRSRTGAIYWVNITCRTYQEPASGDVMAFIFIRDISYQKTLQEIMNTVIKFDYDFMALVNLHHGDYTIYTQDSKKDTLPPVHSTDYEGEFQKYTRKYLLPEYIESNIHDMSISNIQKKLAVNSSFASYFSMYDEGAVRRKKLQFIRLGEENERVLLARTDITEMYEIEQTQIKKLKDACDRAEVAVEAKTEFLSRMSHDLRTPMNVIIGLTSLAIDEVNNPKAMEKTLSDITCSAKYLLSLINDCLSLEKISSGNMELHPAPYPYYDFNNSMRAVIEPLCQEKNIQFIINKKEDINLSIYADQMRMDQIFYNLLSNAVKFTSPGGTVSMLTENIVLKDGQIDFDDVVRDNGSGMSEEFQKHMYEAFSQEANGISSEYQGSGLGLSIVKQLVDLMGADIKVKSRPGAGTEFRVHFSFPEAPVVKSTKPNILLPATQAKILRGKRVLLAEDHPMNAMIAVKILKKAGLLVVTVANGKEAVETFRSVSAYYFDAVLMDIRMPVMNGLDASKAIRAVDRPDAKGIPIIAMTANAFDTDERASLNAGMNAHITKPIDPKVLYKTLASLIAGKSQPKR